MSSPQRVSLATSRRPLYADGDRPATLPRQRNQSPNPSIASLPYRNNPSLSTLFASTSSTASTARNSGTSTPTTDHALSGSTLFGGTEARASSPGIGSNATDSQEIRNIICRAFAPHVGIVASLDTDALCKARGFGGGFLELISPFAETVSGKVIVRDSIGASRTWTDFGLRFMSMTDIRDSSSIRRNPRQSVDGVLNESKASVASVNEQTPSQARADGGDVAQIEDLLERHLLFAELRLSRNERRVEDKDEYLGQTTRNVVQDTNVSPFYVLYLRRLLSGLPLSPHETFTHPVACVIATSSRNPSPIEEFKRLYTSTMSGEHHLPPWVNNDYLRYYVLVHDEDNDDITKSTALYEQMKRHFGLHCHLLRLRSAQCVPSDDESLRLARSEWMTAAEEISLIESREESEDLDDPTPCLFESDAAAIRTFIRELTTQSIVPGMERLCAQWNEQVATRRKGISGRLLSVSKRWGFGIGRTSSSPISASQGGNSSSNYDSLHGFYLPDTPEALMRKLADYAFMLRDFKLAQNTYDVLRSDFEHDKAWKHYAGANEMYLASTMLNTGSPIMKRLESIERWIEAAVHSYAHRCDAPYYALRSLVLAFETAKARGSVSVDDTSRWAARILDMSLTGSGGTPLIMERISHCFAQRKGAGALASGARRRKRAFWSLMAADAWMKQGISLQAERCIDAASMAYGFKDGKKREDTGLAWMAQFFLELHEGLIAQKLEGADPNTTEEAFTLSAEEQAVEEVTEELGSRGRRRSNIPEGAVLVAPKKTGASLGDGFEQVP